MVGRTSIVPRDQALDSELESGAHMTLILIATGLAFLFTATAIIFYLFPVCRVMRRTLFSQPPVNDSNQVQELTNENRVFRPMMTSTPLRQMIALPQRFHQLSYQPDQSTIPAQRSPVFFATRNPAPLLPGPNTSYSVPTPGFYNHRVSPPSQSHANHYYYPHLVPTTLPPPLHITIVPPHTAGWMKIADEVVGRHPFAKPLLERVASQAEIDLISNHVHIPWAHDARRSQPTPVKVLGPAQHAQEQLGHLKLSVSAEITRGGFRLEDNRFGYVSSSLAVPNHDSIQRPEHSAQNDH